MLKVFLIVFGLHIRVSNIDNILWKYNCGNWNLHVPDKWKTIYEILLCLKRWYICIFTVWKWMLPFQHHVLDWESGKVSSNSVTSSAVWDISLLTPKGFGGKEKHRVSWPGELPIHLSLVQVRGVHRLELMSCPSRKLHIKPDEVQ